MPRLVSRNPSYRKHKRSGQAVVTVNGRDVYRGPYGTAASRREYDRVIGEWLAAGRHYADVAMVGAGASDFTVAELIDGYWKHVESYYAVPSGHTGEIGSYRIAFGLVNGLYDPTRVTDFGPLALKAVRDRMVADGWARTYVNRQMGRVRRMFKWGV